MPAIYAHDKFGELVSRRVDRELGELIEKYYTQFEIGLQGPDIFFFYRPWGKNRISRYGTHLHDVSARRFFCHACYLIQQKGRDTEEYAYLMGFICHYILDSECHPYVELMIERTGVQHLEIEEEFEKLLLRMDEEDPLAFPLAELIPTDLETAKAIAPFYSKDITPELVRRSLQYMRMVKKLFTAPCPVKQGILNQLMKATGKYDKMKGLMNQRMDNPACEKTNQGLLLLFEEAVDTAAEMIEDMDACIRTGRKLHPRFNRTFC